jgi:hypothetical protein
MLKIDRVANGDVVFTVTGQLEVNNMRELLALLAAEPAGRRVALDLKELAIVDLSAVRLLQECEGRGIPLRNCPPYIRVWIGSKEENP